MTDTFDPTPLRREVLAVILLDRGPLADFDIGPDGIAHPGAGFEGVQITWSELASAAANTGLPSHTVRRRLARWLRLRIVLDTWLSGPDRPARQNRVISVIRPRALPRDHALHPGSGWALHSVLGGAVDVGLAMRGVDDDGHLDPDSVGLLPFGVLTAAGIDLDIATGRAHRYLDDMAQLAADRLRRDPSAVLRSLGDADVITLLANAHFRHVLLDGQGMRTAAVPSRDRGWLDLGRVDPAFAISAAQLTDPDTRGFDRPILITADEIAMVRAGGRPIGQSLADPAPDEPSRPASRQA
ncbi:MAG: hypothetical protein WCI29_05650 [Actinomycetes bacterium]